MTSKDHIEFNEIDFEENIYDFFREMHYKGKPFSGVLKDGNSIIEFKNGNASGLALSYFPDGKISSEDHYENGEFVQGKNWYNNGKLMSLCTGQEISMYAKDGKLAYESKPEIAVWYYKNGIKKQYENRKLSQTSCYTSTGQLAIEIERENDLYFAKYYDDILICNFKEIITNIYPELDCLSSSSGGHDHFPDHCFQLWVLKLLIEKPSTGKTILNQLKGMVDSKIIDIVDTVEMHLSDFNLTEVAEGDWGYCGYKIKTTINKK